MTHRILGVAALALVTAACGATSAPAATEANAAQTAEPQQGTVNELDAAQVASLVKDGKAVLVDVRTPEEFTAGHIAGAVNMPLDSFSPAEVPHEAGKQTVLYCRSGRRSEVAAHALANADGSATHLVGGITAWEQAGEPITQGN